MAVGPGCYSGGGAGSDPPTTTFYFPVGLAVSSKGNALYVVNSDFDLQWNGGTLQSYDLFSIRRDAATLIKFNLDGAALKTVAGIPFYNAPRTPCPTGQFGFKYDAGLNDPAGSRIGLGQECAPPVNTQNYERDSVVLGAFATDLQLQTADGVVGHRLFAPVRGDATLTWADVGPDNGAAAPAGDDPAFKLNCGPGSGGTRTCDAAHRTGDTVDALDSRGITMPGEPFGMAQTPDGTAIAVTHQTVTETSLLLAGHPADSSTQGDARADAGGGVTSTGRLEVDPSMQFVVNNVAGGGKGIVAVPHDKDASVKPCEFVGNQPPCVRPAFLETSGSSAELDLLGYYDDDGAKIGTAPGAASSQKRPFLAKEAVFPFNTNLSGIDSRGIAIDPTARMACKAAKLLPDQACGELPARVFFANRSPPTLVLATVGGTVPNGEGTYDPDLVTFGTSSIPLPPGPSRVYIAPIANRDHNYELRVFVVNFDSSTISVYDPSKSNLALVDTIFVGPGPFAMAFDPFSLDEVATQAPVPTDTRYPAALNLTRRYRFAYVASFAQSYVQVIDLDQSEPTFESVVFTLGKPTPPKGT